MNAHLLLSVASRLFSTCKLLLTMLGLPATAVRQLSSVATASAWVAAAEASQRLLWLGRHNQYWFDANYVSKPTRTLAL